VTAVEVALTNVCVDVSDDTPTLTVNVLFVTASIVCHAPSDGSPTLGYVCCVALLSLAHNTYMNCASAPWFNIIFNWE